MRSLEVFFVQIFKGWVCSSCGVINQRDLLASKNILKKGRRSLGDTKTNVET